MLSHMTGLIYLMKRCPEFPKKRRYSTKKDAETAIITLDMPFNIYVYFCEACNGWHLASKKIE